MGKYEENISDDSIWITATPTPLAQTLPFYITEAGHFLAGSHYQIKRPMHDSFLLLYTISGQGIVKTGDTVIPLPRQSAVVIDCHIPHEYYSHTDEWEFLWIHFKGSSIQPLYDILYQNGAVRSVDMKNAAEFESSTSRLIKATMKNDVVSCIAVSSGIHSLLHLICASALETENSSRKKEPLDDIQTVIAFIEKNYSHAVSIDDMVKNIHVSKYHFIRCFRRTMGITPYSYLTNYRITMAKTFLRSTDKTVSEIAEICGFLDTSNFITQFKKHTGQKPLQYRHDFS